MTRKVGHLPVTWLGSRVSVVLHVVVTVVLHVVVNVGFFEISQTPLPRDVSSSCLSMLAICLGFSWYIFLVFIFWLLICPFSMTYQPSLHTCLENDYEFLVDCECVASPFTLAQLVKQGLVKTI